MAAEDITKTVIVTPFGLFKYLYMPFGLKKGGPDISAAHGWFFHHLPFVFMLLDDHLPAVRYLEALEPSVPVLCPSGGERATE